MQIKNTLFLLMIVLSSMSIAQKKYNSILLENGFLHVGNGQTIETALVGIKSGKIVLVKNALAYTYKKEDWDTIIDLKGQHIYPGFVAPNCILGLSEIESVRATNDFDEVGTFNPHVRAQIAFNTESKVVSTVKTNGILITQSTPRGGIISGSSAVMFTDGWNWEDATIKAEDGIHLNWPRSIEYKGKKNENYESQKIEINHFFENAKTYALANEVEKSDFRLEAMKNCFVGQKRVYIHANHLQQILDIIDFVKKFNLKYPVIVGGYDSYLTTQKLRDAAIPVMLLRTHSLPENDEDPVNLPYQLPFLLQQGGVKFCIQNEGDMEAMNARNIPFLAGTAMAYGLTEEQAIQSISLNSCEILGISTSFGSIEEGKNATLFISEGNALDMRTNNVVLAFINGQFISLSNSQTDLYEKYSKKLKH
ncbi:MAG: amidohydrolase family protein [Flavobacteriia bacterium]|nr:amidohydrolase family protein [Flavobacteriia bacterium]